MKISELEKKFRRKIKRMNDEELEEFDEWFFERGYDLLEFYDIRKKLHTWRQRQRFLDYIYMYAIAFDKREFDERYDQILFSDAFEYAKSR
jgi:hypothetical protein